jgi:hypothetical protein
MERIIVTVKRRDQARVRDLDLPAGLEISELTSVIASALNWEGGKKGFSIQADPPGRVLKSDETLHSAGVVDGAWLTFIQEGVKTTKKRKTPKSVDLEKKDSSAEPIQGWKTLDGIDPATFVDTEGEEDDGGDDKKPPYVWKEVDI